ncbi:MAG: DUF4296 domain-containing protein [Saprospiraceae bacterium]
MKPRLSEELMVAILCDMHAAEAAINNLYGLNRDSMFGVYHEQIFTIHKVKQEDFEQSLHVWENNPKEMEKLYEKVNQRLSKMSNTSGYTEK